MASQRKPPRSTAPVEGTPLPVAGKPATGAAARATRAARATPQPPDLDERERRQSATRRSVGADVTRTVDANHIPPPAQPTDPT